MGWSMFYPCLCACRSVRTSVRSFLKGLYNQCGMLSKSLNTKRNEAEHQIRQHSPIYRALLITVSCVQPQKGPFSLKFSKQIKTMSEM